MRIALPPSLRIATGLLLAAFLSIVGYQVFLRTSQSPKALLTRADDLSWLNSWIAAAPLYRQAELEFIQKGDSAKALYARVSQVLAQSESSTTIPSQIARLRRDLARPEARDPETRLRILTILGMLETNYDAGMARQTWSEIESLAIQRRHYLLASRAVGEQGIAAFLLGDIATAKKDVEKAWLVAKIDDPAAHIRYASMYGTGLVELHKYKEAIGPLDEAIKVAAKTRNVAYPSIAVNAKIEALSGIGQNDQAVVLAADAMQKVAALHLAGHLYELYQTRARVYEKMNNWNQAVSDLNQAGLYAKQLSYWRGLTEADGLLAEAHLHQRALQPALTAIDEAIDANKRIPDELYFVPKDLAIKAEILAQFGNVKASDDLYEKSADVLDALLSKVPTPSVERQLLGDLSSVYAGYFASLGNQGRMTDAFRVIERARGRVEAQGLSHHELVIPHQPTQTDLQLTKLNLQLLDTDDPAKRAGILDEIYSAEQQLGGSITESVPTPISLTTLQKDLRPSDLFIEYVLDNPVSYVLAVTSTTIHRYELPARAQIEQDATQYRSEIVKQKTDIALGNYILDSRACHKGDFYLKSSRQVRSRLERTKDPETRQNTRGLILHTARSAPKERQMPEPPPADHIVGQLDVGIRKAVEVFQKHDIETFESCEGGTGHAYPEPTVAFYGGPGAGWSAVSVCLTHGLPVQSLRRVWDVLDTNDVTGPHWEITFRERLH